MAKIPSTKIRESKGDVILDVITGAVLVLIVLIVGYPCVYVISCSISNPAALQAGKVILWPVEPCIDAYQFVLNYKQVWVGFRNSIFYCACEVFLQMTMVIFVAYPLSRRYYQGRSFIAFIFYMSTKFSAGIIPLFILKANYLGLYDNIWAIIFSGTVGVSHMLILRTQFQTGIPGDLFDAAMIDGANQFQSLIKIALPLSKATLSVLILYIMVGQWNEYFNSKIYLQNPNLYSLQLVLRPIMTAASAASSQFGGASVTEQLGNSGLDHVRYALIVISSAPPIAAYFIVQKYFKGGVMMGSVKG